MSARENKEPVKEQVQVQLFNLTRGQYMELEKKALAGLRFRDDTGSVQSGFLNGVEHVLRVVREGFTV